MSKNKTHYVDGYLLVVPKKNVNAYRKMAREGANIWMKYGALDYKECMIDDAKPQWVTFTFPKMAKAKPNETVWFSYVTYKSKKHRDQVNTKVMKQMEKDYGSKPKDLPFDMKRMAYGGFTVEVSG